MNNNQKILIIGPAWIGDMVMAQTLFKLLKQRLPNIIIHVLAPAWTCPLLQRMPEIDQIISAPFKHGELSLGKRYKLAKSLRDENYTQAIVLPNSFKSALIPYWAKIPRRTGWRGEMRYGLLNDIRILDKTKLPLMIQRFVALGVDKAEPLPEKISWPELQIQHIDPPPDYKLEDKILALCPGAEYGPAKRWPAKHFATVAKAKLAEGWQIWIFGGNKDQAIASEIQQLIDDAGIDLTGKTSLLQAIDLLALATVVVSNDTGLMHIAAALQRPLIVIYGSSSPQFTPPLSNNVTILSLNLSCSPCFKRICPQQHCRCLQDLKPEMVLSGLKHIISC